MNRDHRIQWHELLGKALADALMGLPYSISSEEELALRSQRLDVLIIEQSPSPQRLVAPPAERPDGLEDLAAHNLLSFKAAGQSFNAWAAEELISHFVTYRKLASIRALRQLPVGDDTPIAEPSQRYPLLPVEQFRCYAIATRFPRNLVKQLPSKSCQKTAKSGLYQLRFGTRTLRLVVINQLELHPRNAPWGLFATDDTHWQAAYRAYRPRSDIGAHLHNLIAYHRLGEGNMAHTQEDMKRDAREWLKSFLPELDPEDRLKGLDPEDRLRGLDPEDRLKGLDPQVIEDWLNKQRRDH